MPVQTLDALVGVAKQSAKGTIATNPTFACGISGGPILTTEVENEKVPATSGKRIATSAYRSRVGNGAEFDVPAYQKGIGLLLLGAMGAVATTGAGPYTHTFTPGDLPYLTIFRKYIGRIEAVKDVKIDELKLAWDGPNPLEVSVAGPGTLWSKPATFVPTTDETGTANYFTPVGGSLKLDVDGAVPVEAQITKGEITVKNSAEGEPLAVSIMNSIVSEGVMEAEVGLTVVPDDLADWNAALTGTPAGTSASETIVTGSFDLTFKCGTDTLQVVGTKVPFIIEHPEGSPEGGRAELEAAGLILGDVSTASFKFVLTNSQATY